MDITLFILAVVAGGLTIAAATHIGAKSLIKTKGGRRRRTVTRKNKK